MRTTSVVLLAALAKLGAATYVLEDDYQPNSFFEKFDFFSAGDPTNSYVTYLDQGQAESEGLAAVRDNAVYLGVDHKNVATGSGRKSVRIETKKTYDHGLIIADIAHMPDAKCGTWPAFWTSGPSWPDQGELDIIEGVNRQSKNKLALHTNAGCSIEQEGNFTGTVMTPNCDVNAPGQAANQGCLFEATKPSSYGAGFNENGGGIFAADWNSHSISIWFFTRNEIPNDIKEGKPDPSKWDLPVAVFAGDCEIDKHVVKQRIIFNTAFCGDWSKGMWGGDEFCQAKGQCEDYVKNNPKDFKETFWSINYLKVFQDREVPAEPIPSSTAHTETKTTKTEEPTQPSSTKSVPTETASETDSEIISETTVSPTATATDTATAVPTTDKGDDKPSESGDDELPVESSDCPRPTPTSCSTYTTWTTYPVVKTYTTRPSEKTGDAIIPIKPTDESDSTEDGSDRRRNEVRRRATRRRHA